MSKKSNNIDEDTYYDSLDELYRLLKKKPVSIDVYQKIFFFYKKTVYKDKLGDSESLHMLEDYMMNRFIADVSTKKITNVSTIQSIATIIRKINNMKLTRWYA